MQVRKNYPEEFKREAVGLAQKNGVAQTARDLGVHVSLIRKWKNRLDQDGEKAFPGKGHPQDEELAQLKRDNARLKEENEILKKAVGIFSKSPR